MVDVTYEHYIDFLVGRGFIGAYEDVDESNFTHPETKCHICFLFNHQEHKFTVKGVSPYVKIDDIVNLKNMTKYLNSVTKFYSNKHFLN